MVKLHIGLPLALALCASTAYAESQAEIAARDNEEGKELMFSNKYAEASAKFHDAVARVPEAKYFFNLCTSLYQEGKFGEALTACNGVAKNNPDDKLKGKTDKLVDRIQTEAKQQGIDLQPQGGGGGETNVTTGGGAPDPNAGTTGGNTTTAGGTPDPNAGTTAGTQTTGGAPPPQPAYAVGRPPTVSLYAAQPTHEYTWALGVDMFGGGGQIGQANVYGSAAVGIRIKGDYILNKESHIGAQAFVDFTHFGQGSMQATTGTGLYQLDVIDVGLAVFKHICPASMSHLCFTPLIGAQVSLLSPANMTDGEGSQVFNYTAAGLRAEADLSYAFGPRSQHVLTAMIGLKAYSKVFSSPSDPNVGPPADQIGLDTGGAIAYLGVGYTLRFDTPLGAAPFITLE